MDCHETSGIYIWVQIGRRKAGQSGNIPIKSNIPKSKFDNVFDIRKEYCLYTKYEENRLAGFFNTTIVGKIFGNF